MQSHEKSNRGSLKYSLLEFTQVAAFHLYPLAASRDEIYVKKKKKKKEKVPIIYHTINEASLHRLCL